MKLKVSGETGAFHFHSLVDLQAAINRFIEEDNQTGAKPFVWRADPDEIIAARNRGFGLLPVSWTPG